MGGHGFQCLRSSTSDVCGQCLQPRGSKGGCTSETRQKKDGETLVMDKPVVAGELRDEGVRWGWGGDWQLPGGIPHPPPSRPLTLPSPQAFPSAQSTTQPSGGKGQLEQGDYHPLSLGPPSQEAPDCWDPRSQPPTFPFCSVLAFPSSVFPFAFSLGV